MNNASFHCNKCGCVWPTYDSYSSHTCASISGLGSIIEYCGQLRPSIPMGMQNVDKKDLYNETVTQAYNTSNVDTTEKVTGVKLRMTKAEYMEFHKQACDKMIDITKAKNKDYTGASEDPFANFRQIGNLVSAPSIVEIGFLTRMSDKFSRIGSFITNGTLAVKDEAVEDTLLDLANYCILLAGYIKSNK